MDSALSIIVAILTPNRVHELRGTVMDVADTIEDLRPAKPTFTPYQKFVVAILAFLQFTLILDFMIISPLGAIVMPALQITPRQFGWAVSSYAFSAALSG